MKLELPPEKKQALKKQHKWERNRHVAGRMKGVTFIKIHLSVSVFKKGYMMEALSV